MSIASRGTRICSPACPSSSTVTSSYPIRPAGDASPTRPRSPLTLRGIQLRPCGRQAADEQEPRHVDRGADRRHHRRGLGGGAVHLPGILRAPGRIRTCDARFRNPIQNVRLTPSCRVLTYSAPVLVLLGHVEHRPIRRRRWTTGWTTFSEAPSAPMARRRPRNRPHEVAQRRTGHISRPCACNKSSVPICGRRSRRGPCPVGGDV
jgi:hypothetical protein